MSSRQSSASTANGEGQLWDSSTFRLEDHWPRESIAGQHFPLRRQPARLLYTIFFALTFPIRLFCVFLPKTAYQRILDANAPKGRSWLDTFSIFIARSLIDDFMIPTGGGMRGVFFKPPLLEKERLRYVKKTTGLPEVYAPTLKVEDLRAPVLGWARKAGTTEADFLTLWWLGRRSEQLRQAKASKGEKIIVYYVGGGYHVGTCYPGDDLGNLSVAVMKEINRQSDKVRDLPQSIVCVEYRKSGVSPNPAALLDALSLYYHLINDLGFEAGDITLLGDSAGAHLVNAVVRYLVEGGEPTPGKIMIVSPWGDQAGTTIEHESSSYKRNLPYDFLSDHFYHYCKDIFASKLNDPIQDLLDVYFSPSALLGKVKTRRKADGKEILITKETEKDIFKDWPATILVWGEHEILKDQSLEILRRLKMSKQAEGKLDNRNLCAFPIETCHAPFVMPSFVFAKQRREALQRMVSWLSLQ